MGDGIRGFDLPPGPIEEDPPTPVCRDAGIWISENADENWANNAIQFPRLIAEISAVGLDEHLWDSLLVAMDLESDQLSELFDRAQDVWDDIKARTKEAGKTLRSGRTRR